MKNRILSGILVGAAMLLVVLSLTDCREQREAQMEDVLATVNGRLITQTEFNYYWAKEERDDDSQAAKKRLLDSLIERAVLAEKAKTAGLEDDWLVRETHESILIARLKEESLLPKVAESSIVSEQDLRDAYENSGKRFMQPSKQKVAVLWLDSRGVAELEERYRGRLIEARAVMENRRLKPEEGFGELSITHSEDHASRFKGGIVGWLQVGVSHDKWKQAIAEIAQSLESGEMSQVFVKPEGVFLVRVLEVEPERIIPFDFARNALRREIIQVRREAIHSDFLESMYSGVEISVKSDGL
ncbi:peptidylprolyl isomerase [Cerasicoccus frondis]|uniref:peptidylprolyl isomerase n=1 Tax=Cerasicoccus frondis TaxID=490090 RepID=UPI002852D997|nr:peptidyl-prolyl cis-trans isomerase [Cerasicoccus frondis]